jgi:hypothetical protein
MLEYSGFISALGEGSSASMLQITFANLYIFENFEEKKMIQKNMQSLWDQ